MGRARFDAPATRARFDAPATRARLDGAARRTCFDGLAVAPETVTSSFTTLAFLALLRVLIKLFFWMDTVDSPRLNFSYVPRSRLLHGACQTSRSPRPFAKP